MQVVTAKTIAVSGSAANGGKARRRRDSSARDRLRATVTLKKR
jgi:hypothetical protein